MDALEQWCSQPSFLVGSIDSAKLLSRPDPAHDPNLVPGVGLLGSHPVAQSGAGEGSWAPIQGGKEAWPSLCGGWEGRQGPALTQLLVGGRAPIHLCGEGAWPGPIWLCRKRGIWQQGRAVVQYY